MPVRAVEGYVCVASSDVMSVADLKRTDSLGKY